MATSIYRFHRHGESGATVGELLPHISGIADRLCFIKSLHTEQINHDPASAALVTDLAQRGLLDETQIVWGGEFGLTVYSQGKLTTSNYGRDHHPRCFTIWMAGGGIQPGTTYGRTDDYSYNVIDEPVSVHDLHATILHLMGIQHDRLTYRDQGRDYRLTDVHGEVVQPILV